MDNIFTNLESKNIDMGIGNFYEFSNEKKEAERIIENFELEKLADNLNKTEISIRSNNPNDYEELLQKLEGDIRNHIKIQHQYRIYTDSLKSKIEELEKFNNEQKNVIENLNEVQIFLILSFLRKLINPLIKMN